MERSTVNLWNGKDYAASATMFLLLRLRLGMLRMLRRLRLAVFFLPGIKFILAMPGLFGLGDFRPLGRQGDRGGRGLA